MTFARLIVAAMLAAVVSPAALAAPHWAIVIHGGAGVIERKDITPDQEAAYRASLTRAIGAGIEVLKNRGTSLDAVEGAIKLMEDDPLFNAGRGAVFTAEGRNELDAAIMDGSSLTAACQVFLSHTPSACDGDGRAGCCSGCRRRHRNSRKKPRHLIRSGICGKT